MKRSWLWLSLWMAACGGGEGGDDDRVVEEEYGVIDPPDEPVPAIVRGKPLPEAWSRFCMATFTRDFTFDDGAGLSIERGEEFLLYRLDESFLGREFAVLIPEPNGVREYNEPFFDGPSWPFETNCDPEHRTNHIAVFADLTLYEDPELTRPICELERGTTFPFDSWGSVYSPAEELVELDIGGWSEPCAGHVKAYFAIPDGGAWPILDIFGPGN